MGLNWRWKSFHNILKGKLCAVHIGHCKYFPWTCRTFWLPRNRQEENVGSHRYWMWMDANQNLFGQKLASCRCRLLRALVGFFVSTIKINWADPLFIYNQPYSRPIVLMQLVSASISRALLKKFWSLCQVSTSKSTGPSYQGPGCYLLFKFPCSCEL